jgi:hypothetical protein
MLLLPSLLATLSQASVSLTLTPADQCVTVNQIVDVVLMLSTDTPTAVAATDVILSWNPAELQFLQAVPGSVGWFVAGFFNDPDGINTSIVDGNALYTMLGNPLTPPALPPDIAAVTFQFKVLSSGQVAMLPSLGAFGKTQVLGTTPGSNLTGALSGPASITVASGPSAQIPRLGTPPNPDAFKPDVAHGPVVGLTWNPYIDHTAFFPGSLLDLMAIGPAVPLNIPTVPYGTFLCDIFSFPYILRGAVPGNPFSMPIPLNCSLVGLQACTQAASVDLIDVKLTNALDITIGSF